MHCKHCNTTKATADFYAGNKTRCKECVCASVRANRLAKIDYYRSYDKMRAARPDRVSARAAYAMTQEGIAAAQRARSRYAGTDASLSAKERYAKSAHGRLKKQEWLQSEAGKESHRANTLKQRALRADRYKARSALGNAVRDGRVIPWPVCALPDCDRKPEAHHADYTRPLDVVWLCSGHHKATHKMARELAF